MRDAFTTDRFAEWWGAFCDGNGGDYPIDFLDNAEEAGLIDLVPVDDDALDDPFAWERGIERGGSMFVLTDAGRERYASALPTPAQTASGVEG